jgi:cyanophycinase
VHANGASGKPAQGSSAASSQSPIRPLFLLADSQLLFWKDGGERFLERVRAELGPGPHRAAYLGASNGDVPEYYDIFVAAMESIDLRVCRMIPSAPSAVDRAFLDEARVILLAGGDPARGMRVLRDNGLAERIVTRYAAGAVIIGVSAGAVQLGQHIPDPEGGAPMDGFGLVPLVIAAHEEPEWATLAESVKAFGGSVRGVGLPLGGGAVVHADLSLQPVRKALVEIDLVEGAPRHALLWPGLEEGKGSAGEPMG